MFGSKVSAVPASFSREAADPLYEGNFSLPVIDTCEAFWKVLHREIIKML